MKQRIATTRSAPVTRAALLRALLACTVTGIAGGARAAEDVFPPAFPTAAASGNQADIRIPPNMRAEPLADGRWRVTFTLSAAHAVNAQSAAVAGDFTGWQGQAAAMQRASDGSFSAVIVIPAGTRRYKFILDGTRWIADPANPRGTDDGNSGKNSVIDLGAEVALDPSLARLGDGAVEGAAFRHSPHLPSDREPVADAWHVRARTLRGDVEHVDLYWQSPATPAAPSTPRTPATLRTPATPAAPAGTTNPAAATTTPVATTGHLPMAHVGTRGPFDIWDAVLPLTGNRTIAYTFVAKDGQLSVSDPNIYSLDTTSASPLRTPAWAKDAVWYQVMVDRFRNGDSSNDPKGTIPWTHDWYKPFGAEGNDGQTFYKHFIFGRFGGGDIAGLRAQLPYLRSLGVNALYLMPMFQASTPHKYNTANYIHVDEHFGTKGDYAPAVAKEDILDLATWTFTPTDKAFLDFIREAKGMGFRIIIDGVFNHCGTDHPAFQDVKRNGKDSKFASWFDITSWDPFKYDAWWGFSELPVFRKDPEHGLAAESVRKHLFEITRRWMDPDGDGDPSDGVDGWRLDVPNEVPLPFWHEWCKHVRSINPDAYIAGEIWERADQWLDGKAFDAVMNYEFAKPLVHWVIDRANKITPTALDRSLAELRLAYPAECTYAMMNLVDSHDTDRVSSMAKNPDRIYNQKNREQEGDPYDASKPGPADYAKQRLMALVQMTYVGAPMIYSGDEVGMWGSNDPNNRKPMVWDDLGVYQDPQQSVDSAILDHYRTVIALRNAHPALRTGTFRTVRTDDAQDVWAFVRAGHGEELLVALNASDRPATVSFADLGDGWQDVYGTPGIVDNGMVSTTIPAVGGRVWHRRIK